MDFPDMKSLEGCAKVHKFRKPNKDEKEEQFRSALADFVATKDFIESEEIRNKVGWDKFSKKQNEHMIIRKVFENLTCREINNIEMLGGKFPV